MAHKPRDPLKSLELFFCTKIEGWLKGMRPIRDGSVYNINIMGSYYAHIHGHSYLRTLGYFFDIFGPIYSRTGIDPTQNGVV